MPLPGPLTRRSIAAVFAATLFFSSAAPAAEKVKIDLKETSLKDALARLEKDAGLKYRVIGNALEKAGKVTWSGEAEPAEILADLARQAGVKITTNDEGTVLVESPKKPVVFEDPKFQETLNQAFEEAAIAEIEEGLDPPSDSPAHPEKDEGKFSDLPDWSGQASVFGAPLETLG